MSATNDPKPLASKIRTGLRLVLVLTLVQLTLLAAVLYMAYRLFVLEKNRIPRPVINMVVHERYPDVAPEMELMTVRVVAQDGMGSGVVMGKNLVMTNYHVVKASQEGRTLWIDATTSRGATRLAATIATVDAARDLAMLRVPGHNFEKWAHVADTEPAWGITIFMVGCPGGNLPIPTRGYYVRPAGEKFIVGCLGFWGNSGGPVFDANTGRLLGLTNGSDRPREIPSTPGHSQLVYPAHIFYCVSAEQIRAHLKENEEVLGE
jgi:hypothetical protein